MASASIIFRRSTNLLMKKSIHPLRSTAVAPSITRSFNTNAAQNIRDSDEEGSLDPHRRRDTPPPSFFPDVFDPFSPTRSVSQVLNLMDQLMENPSRGGLRRGWHAKEDMDALHLRVDMPGLGKEHVKISVEEKNTLTIKGEGEKESGDEESGRRYSGRIELPSNLYEIDQIKAEMKNGVLKVFVPRVKEEDRKDIFQVKVE